MTNLIYVRNVNEALHRGIGLLAGYERQMRTVSPRGMKTVEAPGPVLTTYNRPMERVLFHPMRDANPFFHFFEGLWIIAGRADVAFLAHFNKRMLTFSDDGLSLHGAYGWRARFEQAAMLEAFGRDTSVELDQITVALNMLRRDPDSRRVVIQLYQPLADIPMLAEGKDVPCNTAIYLKLRNNALQMTVTCRSNDMLWGAYGANAVHFSMLQEYLAGKLGAEVGQLHQLSDSFHVYTEGVGGELWTKMKEAQGSLLAYDYYDTGAVKPYSMQAGHPQWDEDLERFFNSAITIVVMHNEPTSTPSSYLYAADFGTPWFRDVAVPMFNAHLAHKLNDSAAAVNYVATIAAADWRVAAIGWLARRRERPIGVKENA